MDQAPFAYPIELPIAGRDIDSVELSRYSPSLTLNLLDSSPSANAKGSFSIRIDEPFDWQTAVSSTRVDPNEPSPHLLTLRSRQVLKALAEEDGTLRLAFVDGSSIVVPPGKYEAWEFLSDEGASSPNHWRVVSKAGGGLAVWMPPSGA